MIVQSTQNIPNGETWWGRVCEITEKKETTFIDHHDNEHLAIATMIEI